MLKRKISTSRNGVFGLSRGLSRIVLGGIVGICLCLAFMGCASLGRVTPPETKESVSPETPKSLAFYHFLGPNNCW